MKIDKQDAYHKGLYSEVLAIASLILRGYKIRAWRYKTKVGEIDIIAQRGKILAFIEVKARASPETALMSLTPRMRARISRAAKYYLQSHAGDLRRDLRFDLITVCGFSVRHLDNAWLDGPY